MMSDARNNHRTILLAVAGLAGLVWASACGDGAVEPPEEPARPVSIAVEPSAAELTWLGETILFRATITDQYGAAFPGTVAWSSSDEAVFTVDAGGTATAVANGTGTVTATFQTISATAGVAVEQWPAGLDVESGGGQVARRERALPEPVVVRVADAGGSAVEGTRVTFTPATGHGTANPLEAVTDASGLARTTWTLGAVRGEQRLTVAVAAVSGLSAVATATALAPSDDVQVIEVVGGGRQSANTGAALRDPVVVRALDAAGSPVTEATVTFTPATGHGTANPPEAVTDALGMAQTQWTLGPADGRQTLVAAAGQVSARITATALSPDRAALEAFYHAAGGPDWTDYGGNWLSDAPLGEWEQVETNSDGRVVQLALAFNNMQGTIAPELGALSELRELALGYSDLTGPIPPELGNLSKLHSMTLTQLPLTGEIPPELGNLGSLELLGIRGARFDGSSIPPELGNLSRLGFLELEGNRLTGEIPPELGNLTGLYQLRLNNNSLTGAIPTEFENLVNLERLHLENNQLTGRIPPGIGLHREMIEIWLSDNQLTGPIPETFGNLRWLRGLILSRNNLTGQLPPALGSLASLEYLDLADNDLSGPVPPELGRASSLGWVILTRNEGMSGELPGELTALTLRQFHTGGTGLCAPADEAFREWLATVPVQRVVPCEARAAAGAYLTQAVQSREFPVPLVAGREALLRVFVTAANAAGATMPPVRARFFMGDAEIHLAEIAATSAAIPADVREGDLSASANAVIPAEAVVPGLEMVIEVDPGNTLDPSVNVARRIPDTGRLAVDVKAMPPLDLTVVPVVRSSDSDPSILDFTSELTADHEFFHDTRTLLPVGEMKLTIREPLISSHTNSFSVLSEIAAIRVAEGGSGHYLGLSDALGGGISVAHTPGWVAVALPYASTVAHELGHNMVLQHAPCGGAPGADPGFPTGDGSIGSWGYDFRTVQLVDQDVKDLMGYCRPRWISEYHFANAVRYRLLTDDSAAGPAVAAPSRTLLLWGSAGPDGTPVLEPAFVVDAPPTLPDGGGAHRIIGLDASGDELFSLSFDMREVADGDGGATFAFAVPVRPEWEGRLTAVTLTGPGGTAVIDAGSGATAALLRDPDTGRIQGIVRDWPPADLGDAGTGRVGGAARFDAQVSRGIPAPLLDKARRGA